jgi:hypothetical protein
MHQDMLAAADFAARVRRRARGQYAPASIQVRMRLRECSGNSCASARSSRMPANSAGMVSARWAPAAASGL